MFYPCPQLRLYFHDGNGHPLVGGKLKTFVSNSTIPIRTVQTYRNAEDIVLNPTEITLDERGECTVFLTEGVIYRFELYDADGALVLEQDGISVPSGSGSGGSATTIAVESVSDGIDVQKSVMDSGVVLYTISAKKIEDAIEAEKNRAESAESSLSKSIADETKRATEAEKGLADAIDAEKKRAEEAERALSERISEETERAVAAEKASRTEIVAGDNITVDKTTGEDGHDIYTINGEKGGDNDKVAVESGAVSGFLKDVLVSASDMVNLVPSGNQLKVNLALPSDVVIDSAYTHIDAATEVPLMDGIASTGISTKYAREDHVHPSDTSREDKTNKTTVVLGTSDSKYPTDKAVAEFVNSSIATNTANYISNNGEPFTSVEQLEAYSGPVTNNDYAFVTGTDSEGNTYYDRYKATASGETVTWALEYRLNNSSFTAAQWSAINSGITSALVAKIHTHSNKDVLDGITSTDVANWNSKQNSLTAGDNITIDGSTISSDQVFVATYGTTKYAEVKKAYEAGKICTAIKNTRYYYLTLFESDSAVFTAPAPNPNIFTVTLNANNSWTSYNPWLQNHLTFDTSPTAGSKNPVTSDGIKTAIDEKANELNSVAIFDGYMRRMNESTGWRRLAYKQFDSTNSNLNALFRLYLFGSNNDHIGLGDLIVNIRFNASGSAPEFVTCNLLIHKPLNTLVKVRVVGVAGNAVVELWFRPITFSLLTLSCLGNGIDVTPRTKDWTFGRYLSSTDPEPVEDIANNIYLFSGTDKRVQLDINNPISGNLVAMDAKGLVKDSGISITSSDIANWNSKMDKQSVGNVSEPVYLENGMAKVATNVATRGKLDEKLNVDGSNATTAGVTSMMRKVPSGTGHLSDASSYFGDSDSDHEKIVRRPVLDIWNYVKDNLGTAGSNDRPVYFDGGVPKECDTVLPCSIIDSGSETGYGVYVGGNPDVGSYTRCYCSFLLTATASPDLVAHTYIGTFTFRNGSVLNYELKCLTGTPNYPMRIAVSYNKNSGSTYTLGVYVIPADPTVNTYANYKLTRIASASFTWACTAINASDCAALDNDGAKPALAPIRLFFDGGGPNVQTTGGSWLPTFDKGTINKCRGIVDLSVQVDMSLINQTTYVETLSSYTITLVNSSGTDILSKSLHQRGIMPRQTKSSTSGGTVDISHTHRFVFPITESCNLFAGYRPKITLPSNYPLDSTAQVSVFAICSGIVHPYYGKDTSF